MRRSVAVAGELALWETDASASSIGGIIRFERALMITIIIARVGGFHHCVLSCGSVNQLAGVVRVRSRGRRGMSVAARLRDTVVHVQLLVRVGGSSAERLGGLKERLASGTPIEVNGGCRFPSR